MAVAKKMPAPPARIELKKEDTVRGDRGPR